jgi:ribosomal protein L11 methyltransferase
MDNWTRVVISTTSEGVEVLSASLLSLGINGFEITDPKDLDVLLAHKAGRWDYIDDGLLRRREEEASVTVYLPQNGQGAETLSALRDELKRLKAMDRESEWGALTCGFSDIAEEDWAFAWKRYYHPTKIGERLVVCPTWEDYEPQASEVVIRLDPGMAFGTGTHESTRLCMRLMEKYLKAGDKVLDLGCGSGILGISAVLLGAESAYGVDIDEDAARVANENAAQNGVFIASGIIDTREDDVKQALAEAGLAVIECLDDRGWIAMACTRREP